MVGCRNRIETLERNDVARELSVDKEIFYVGDPMCSWCWGFAPVARTIKEQFSDIPFSVILGGLRPGENAEPLDERLKQQIEPHWRRVHEMTGQPFDFSFFERKDFVFDTEPACRAVVAIREIAPNATFPFFASLQRAFYAENVDITVAENYAPLLATQGVDRDGFMSLFEDERIRKETYGDFTLARRLGAQGFPTVVLRKDKELSLLTVGYQSFETLEPPIRQYFGG